MCMVSFSLVVSMLISEGLALHDECKSHCSETWLDVIFVAFKDMLIGCFESGK